MYWIHQVLPEIRKSLSRSKDYGELVKDSLDILAEDGILIASTNAANVSIEQFQTMIEEEFHAKNVSFEQLALYRLPKDFRRRIPFRRQLSESVCLSN